MTREVEINVAGGMCRLTFKTGVSTGLSGSDTSPGVGFELLSEVPAFPCGENSYTHGTGVIGRSDIVKLRDALDAFLSERASAT